MCKDLSLVDLVNGITKAFREDHVWTVEDGVKYCKYCGTKYVETKTRHCKRKKDLKSWKIE